MLGKPVVFLLHWIYIGFTFTLDAVHDILLRHADVDGNRPNAVALQINRWIFSLANHCVSVWCVWWDQISKAVPCCGSVFMSVQPTVSTMALCFWGCLSALFVCSSRQILLPWYLTNDLNSSGWNWQGIFISPPPLLMTLLGSGGQSRSSMLVFVNTISHKVLEHSRWNLTKKLMLRSRLLGSWNFRVQTGKWVTRTRKLPVWTQTW